MSIRAPSEAISVPTLDFKQSDIAWHSLECELVTPMYGGGVKSATVDLQMPIRVGSIRGQLRSWWRLLAQHKWKLGNTKSRQDAEFALWGGMGDSNDGRASQVFLRVKQPKVTHHDLMDWIDVKLPYVMFPASNETDANIEHKLLKVKKENNQYLNFTLEFAFSNKLKLDEKRQNQVIETLQWWANFGGLGARTRKGLGAVHVVKSDSFSEILQPLTKEDAVAASCRLVTSGASADPLVQLQNGIRKLSEFRQKANLGRNPAAAGSKSPAGRSRWPEPDALRRIQKTPSRNHKPEHKAGNMFPRAMFGLPIIFHFVAKNGEREPGDTTVTLANAARLMSPLLIRPYYTGKVDVKGNKQWASAALLLPYEHLKDMQVCLSGGGKSTDNYPIWNEKQIKNIKPIEDNNGTDPLDAFLKFFAK